MDDTVDVTTNSKRAFGWQDSAGYALAPDRAGEYTLIDSETWTAVETGTLTALTIPTTLTSG